METGDRVKAVILALVVSVRDGWFAVEMSNNASTLNL